MNHKAILFFMCCIIAVAHCTSYCTGRLPDRAVATEDNTTANVFDEIERALARHYFRPIISFTVRPRFVLLDYLICTPGRESMTEDEEDYVAFQLLMDYPDTTNYSEPSIRIPPQDYHRRMLLSDGCYERGSPYRQQDDEPANVGHESNNTTANAHLTALLHANPLIRPSVFRVSNEPQDADYVLRSAVSH